MRLTFDQYHRLYRALDAELRRQGIRDQIKIISGDLLSTNQIWWLTDLALNLSDVSDGFSIHAYWDYWDTPKLRRRATEVPPILDGVPVRFRRPLYITEFGVRGFEENHKVEPGAFWDDRPIADTNLQAMEIGWFMIEAINQGFVALVQWDMADIWYDRRMHYGVIGEPGNHWKLKPGYSLLKMFTQTTRPGWSSVRVEGSQADESVAAMRSAMGEWTVFVLNRSEEARPFRINGLIGGGRFRKMIWQGTRLIDEGPWLVKDGTMESTLLPMSVTAFTSIVTGLESGGVDESGN